MSDRPQNTDIQPGRWVADPPPGTTLVLFGLRVNQWARVWSWWPVVSSWRAMLAEEAARPDESGLLWSAIWRDGRTYTVMSYWCDCDMAMEWAQDARFRHVAAWRKYNRGRVGDSGDVGLWHEVIAIEPDQLHTIYRNVESRGLATTRTEPADAAHLRRFREQRRNP